jgi:uncharacterized DUF497 family protein
MGKKEPWVESLYAAGYKKINLDEIKTQFDYLEFCLTQVCADNELGALLQGLDGEYVRNPDVLPTGKNMHTLDPQSIPTEAAVKSAKVVVDRLLERQMRDVDFYDPDHSENEDRYLIVGESVQGRLLIVSYTERGNKIRLISARETTKTERETYEEG